MYNQLLAAIVAPARPALGRAESLPPLLGSHPEAFKTFAAKPCAVEDSPATAGDPAAISVITFPATNHHRSAHIVPQPEERDRLPVLAVPVPSSRDQGVALHQFDRNPWGGTGLVHSTKALDFFFFFELSTRTVCHFSESVGAQRVRNGAEPVTIEFSLLRAVSNVFRDHVLWGRAQAAC